MSKTEKEVMIIYASFAYMANVLERNGGKLPMFIMDTYRRTAKITKMYYKEMDNILESVNEAIKGHDVIIIDELLASVAILAHYKEKVQNRSFLPMRWNEINLIMNATIDDIKDYDKVNRTLDYAEFVVDSILNKKGI